jgi:hypothetical protein
MAICIYSYPICFSKKIFTGLQTRAVLERIRTEAAKNLGKVSELDIHSTTLSMPIFTASDMSWQYE